MNSIEQAVKDIFQKAAPAEDGKSPASSTPVALEEAPATLPPTLPNAASPVACVDAPAKPDETASRSLTTQGRLDARQDGPPQTAPTPSLWRTANPPNRPTAALPQRPASQAPQSNAAMPSRVADRASAQKIIHEADKKFAGISETSPEFAKSCPASPALEPQTKPEPSLETEPARASSYNYSRSRFGIAVEPDSSEPSIEGQSASRRKMLLICGGVAVLILGVVAGVVIRHSRVKSSDASMPQLVPAPPAVAVSVPGDPKAQPSQTTIPAAQVSSTSVQGQASSTNVQAMDKRAASTSTSSVPAPPEKPNRLLKQLKAPLVAPQRVAPSGTEVPAAPVITGGIPLAGGQPAVGIIAPHPQLPAPPVETPIGGKFEQARLLSSVQPAYPPAARQIHAQGNVVIQATIDTTGHATNFKILSGSPLLQTAAMDALRKWRYEPAKLNGQPTSVQTVVTIKFKLNE